MSFFFSPDVFSRHTSISGRKKTRCHYTGPFMPLPEKGLYFNLALPFQVPELPLWNSVFLTQVPDPSIPLYLPVPLK